jgi:hypothetical protein
MHIGMSLIQNQHKKNNNMFFLSNRSAMDTDIKPDMPALIEYADTAAPN